MRFHSLLALLCSLRLCTTRHTFFRITLSFLAATFLASKLHCSDEDQMGSLLLMQVILSCSNTHTITIPIDLALNTCPTLPISLNSQLKLLIFKQKFIWNGLRYESGTIILNWQSRNGNAY